MVPGSITGTFGFDQVWPVYEGNDIEYFYAQRVHSDGSWNNLPNGFAVGKRVKFVNGDTEDKIETTAVWANGSYLPVFGQTWPTVQVVDASNTDSGLIVVGTGYTGQLDCCAPETGTVSGEAFWFKPATGASGPLRCLLPEVYRLQFRNLVPRRLNDYGDLVFDAEVLEGEPGAWSSPRTFMLIRSRALVFEMIGAPDAEFNSDGVMVTAENDHGRVWFPIDITVKKKNTLAPPYDGLVVEKNDVLEISLNDVPADRFPLASSQIVWCKQQLKTDGSWTEWVDMGSQARGVKFDYPAVSSGIFRMKAVALNQQEATFIRTRDERKRVSDGSAFTYGDGRLGEPDAIGVVDEPWQIAVRYRAKTSLGSTAYASAALVPAHGPFPQTPPGNHCNIFVAHKANDGGTEVPVFNGWLAPYDPPLANQWSGTQVTTATGLEGQDFNVAIQGWKLLPASAFPQPGYIIAKPSAKTMPRGPGHCGIVDYDGASIAAGSGFVHKLLAHHLLDPKSRMRSYDPNYNPQYVEGWHP